MKKKNTSSQLNLFTEEDFELTISETDATSKTEIISDKENTFQTMDSSQSMNSTQTMDSSEETKNTKSYTPLHTEEEINQLFIALAQSDFRSSIHLKRKDKDYIKKLGLDTIRQHAKEFVHKRLAPRKILNEGRQTPMHGHPVFIAQHATGCCCRGCLYKWHHIEKNKELSEQEQSYVIDIIMRWIFKEYVTL